MCTDPRKVIAAKLANLEIEYQQQEQVVTLAEQEVSRAEQRATMARSKLQWIAAKREATQEMLDAIPPSGTQTQKSEEPPTGQGELHKHNGDGGGIKPAPSKAVVALLRERPNLTKKEIVNALDGKVDSKARNVKHNIATTVYNAAKAGKIVLDEVTGRYSLPPDE
jgi:hypothetical protein